MPRVERFPRRRSGSKAGLQLAGSRQLRSTSIATPAEQQGRTLFGLLKKVWSEYQRDYARYHAAAMVYYALVSLFPLLLLLLASLGLMLRFSDVAAAAEQDVLRTIESSLGAPIRATLEKLLDQLQEQSVIASWISLGGLLLTASALFRQLRLSFRAIWKYQPPLVSGTVRHVMKATFMEQAISYVLILMGAALLLFALALIAIFQWLGGRLQQLPWIGDIGWLISVPTALIMVTVTFAMLFRFLPPVRIGRRQIWIVAVVCAIAWLVASEILTLYAVFFADKFGAWGAIGGLLMVMLWMYIVSQILFYGAELCKVMSEPGWAVQET